MSLRTTARAIPTLLRVSFAEAVAYRAEMLVWILATTMPLVMLALWTAVAREAPVGRFGERQFVAYFLVTFIIRQVTGAWVAWEMNMEIRDGSLALRLMRPVHPFLHYTAENVASVPLRALIALPVAVIALLVVGSDQLAGDPAIWLAAVVATLGSWLITLGANFAIGALGMLMESSLKVADVWVLLYFVFSGYLVPVELFPARVRPLLDWLPFRYQAGLPVELITGAHDRSEALALLARQWGFVVLTFALAFLVWKRGLRRFAAYGG